MITPETMIVTLIGAVFASTGFWAFVQKVWEVKNRRKSAEAQLMICLARKEICEMATEIIAKGYITREEYEDLEALYTPYIQEGGNSSGKKLGAQALSLPIKEDEKHE